MYLRIFLGILSLLAFDISTQLEVDARSSTRLTREPITEAFPSRTNFQVTLPVNTPNATPSQRSGKFQIADFIKENFRSIPRKPEFTVARKLARLNNKDVVIFIDKSSSMKTEDMPGGLSRWDWSQKELANLAYNHRQVTHSRLDVVLFDNRVTKYSSVNLASLPNIFSQNYPFGGTNVTGALKGEIDSFLDSMLAGNKRPIIMAVITDGAPSSARSLKDLIIKTSHRLKNSPNSVKLTFLQIGQERQGNKLLPELDHGLVGDGALFDIVDTKTSEEVRRNGLLNSLVDSVGA